MVKPRPKRISRPRAPSIKSKVVKELVGKRREYLKRSSELRKQLTQVNRDLLSLRGRRK